LEPTAEPEITGTVGGVVSTVGVGAGVGVGVGVGAGVGVGVGVGVGDADPVGVILKAELDGEALFAVS